MPIIWVVGMEEEARARSASLTAAAMRLAVNDQQRPKPAPWAAPKVAMATSPPCGTTSDRAAMLRVTVTAPARIANPGRWLDATSSAAAVQAKASQPRMYPAATGVAP